MDVTFEKSRTPMTAPDPCQEINGLPVYTDIALFEHLFGGNYPLHQALTIARGEAWMAAHNAFPVMASENRSVAVERAKARGRECLLLLGDRSPFIAPAPTQGRV